MLKLHGTNKLPIIPTISTGNPKPPVQKNSNPLTHSPVTPRRMDQVKDDNFHPSIHTANVPVTRSHAIDNPHGMTPMRSRKAHVLVDYGNPSIGGREKRTGTLSGCIYENFENREK